MKKIIWIIPIALLVLMACKSNSVTVTNEDLIMKANEKVTEMQKLIGFNDYQADKLINLEYTHLVKMQKADNCYFCNKNLKMEKLKKQREIDLQKYLSRDEYIKYHAIENDLIKKTPARAQ